MKNLSKQYRDKSAISNKSEFTTLKGLRNDIVEPSEPDVSPDVLSSKNKSAKKRKHRHKERSSKREEDRSTKREGRKHSQKKRRGKSTKHQRENSSQGHKSKKSKSKSRFSNNLGFNHL